MLIDSNAKVKKKSNLNVVPCELRVYSVCGRKIRQIPTAVDAISKGTLSVRRNTARYMHFFEVSLEHRIACVMRHDALPNTCNEQNGLLKRLKA